MTPDGIFNYTAEMKNKILAEYFNVSESKALVVLLWLLNHRDEENKVYTTLDTIADECKVTKVTVNRVFQRLYSKKFLIKIRNGQYQLQKV